MAVSVAAKPNPWYGDVPPSPVLVRFRQRWPRKFLLAGARGEGQTLLTLRIFWQVSHPDYCEKCQWVLPVKE